MKKIPRTLVSLVVLAGVILFHTTGIKPAVYGEFGPAVWAHAQYQDYTSEAVTTALAKDQDVVIYFWANRCPTCTRFEKKLLSDVDNIPANVMILAADIDRDTEAKQHYWVRSQSTTVYLDNDGNVRDVRVARDHSLQHILSALNK